MCIIADMSCSTVYAAKCNCLSCGPNLCLRLSSGSCIERLEVGAPAKGR